VTDDAKPRRARGIETYPSGDDLLVHDPQRGKVHVLNRTAGAIFSLCDGEHDVAAIAETVAARWAADEAVVAADVATILNAFRRLALLEAR
jgi:PqqD family protein of HPr-rel-A system